ncbi:PREDICTED: uncharacterized protein LOC109174439 [Ipomoea nil]|uniref:uncharacterized protein LOC109174439 n=1 Tax=Ipomoea nil TaxID=35883 RepID=UPI000901B308|nr:PREDICTED: uncharacterized protein LOC109174439 [Ipomoea nil]
MLTQYAIEYRSRPVIKGQSLADFLVECTSRETRPPEVEDPEAALCSLATDGSSSKKGADGGVVITSPEGFNVYYALMYQFNLTNNEAEYEAFVNGLQCARELGAEYIRAQIDSALVVGQVLGDYEVNGERLQAYRDLAMEKLTLFRAYTVRHVPRLDNADADILSKLAQDAPEHMSKIARILMILRHSIHRLPVAPIQPAEKTWISDLMEYLQHGRLPDDPQRARKAKLRAPRFQVQEGRLYRRSYGGPLMRCLTSFEADLVMNELHSGMCSSHQGGRSLARRIMVIGYYWPSIQLDCKKLARGCETYYFPKWIEAEPLAMITSQQCAKFLWRNVISRFGVPVHLISDNGRQFISQYFQNFLATIGTTSIRSAMAYPQGNGQVENANRTILEGLKKKLHSAGRSWADVLPYVLWTYCTTPREATLETPFALVYGAEARLPIKAWILTTRERSYNAEENEHSMAVDLDDVEEKREIATRRMAEYQKRVKSTKDVRVHPRYFQVGDYVLRRRETSYPGTYRLETTTGE